MSNLTVRYQILLTEDISKKSGAMARALETSSRRQVKTLQQTDKAATLAAKSVAGVGKNTSLAKISADAGKAQSSLGNVAAAAQRADASLSRMGAGQSSFSRMNNYLVNIGRNLDAARQKAARFGTAIGKVDGMATGAAAGTVAAVAMLKRPMDFDTALSHATNTAYAGKSFEEKVAGKAALESAVNEAVQKYGGSRDSAAGALDKMIASNEFSIEESRKLLPQLQEAATASGADVLELSDIAIKAKDFGLTSEQIGLLLSKAIKGGQEGRFELKDMAKFFPELLTQAADLGMSGMGAVEQIISDAQLAIKTAGSTDKAGTNMINLWAKINSQDTALDFQRKFGYDLSGSLAKAREDGYSAPDAFVNFVEQIAMEDKRFAALKEKLKTATGDEEKEALNAMASIIQKSAVGQVLQDKGAGMMLAAYLQNKVRGKEIREAVKAEDGSTTKENHKFIASTVGYQVQQAANEADIARSNVFHELEGSLNSILTSVTGLSREFPALTKTVVAAAGAWGIFKAAAVGRGMMQLLHGAGAARMAGGMPGMMSTVPMGGGIPIPMGGGAGGMGALLRNPLAMRALGIVGGGVLAYNTLSTLNDNKLSEMQKAESLGSTIGTVGGGALGMMFGGPMGAMIGSSVGGWLGKNALTGGGMYDEGMTHPDMMDFGYLSTPHKQAPIPAGLDAAAEKLSTWDPPEIQIGKGMVDFHMFIHDERTDVTTSVRQQPENLNINPGSTNPGGY